MVKSSLTHVDSSIKSITELSVWVKDRESKRIDTFLSVLFSDCSRSYIQRLIDRGDVWVDGVAIKKNLKIYRGNVIRVEWRVEKMRFESEPMDLDIVFENELFAVINKDAGVNVHPPGGEGGKSGTLVNGLLHHFGSLSVINGTERPGLVHRLDKDTSGLIMIAKNDVAMRALQRKIEKRTIDKFYLAVVIGAPKDDLGYIESFIGRDPHDRKKMTAIDPVNPKLAKTKFRVLERMNGLSLIEVELLTGRTHQIRVHLSSIGFPIIGDSVYGREKVNREIMEKYHLNRQWLHAFRLEFCLFGEEYRFVAPIKKDLLALPFEFLKKMG